MSKSTSQSSSSITRRRTLPSSAETKLSTRTSVIVPASTRLDRPEYSHMPIEVYVNILTGLTLEELCFKEALTSAERIAQTEELRRRATVEFIESENKEDDYIKRVITVGMGRSLLQSMTKEEIIRYILANGTQLESLLDTNMEAMQNPEEYPNLEAEILPDGFTIQAIGIADKKELCAMLRHVEREKEEIAAAAAAEAAEDAARAAVEAARIATREARAAAFRANSRGIREEREAIGVVIRADRVARTAARQAREAEAAAAEEEERLAAATRVDVMSETAEADRIEAEWVETEELAAEAEAAEEAEAAAEEEELVAEEEEE